MNNRSSINKLSIVLELSNGAHLKILTTKNITKEYVDGLNDPEVNLYLTGVRLNHQNTQSVKKYVDENFFNNNSYLFGIFVAEKLIGTARLYNTDVNEGTGDIGILVFKKSYWGQGWGKNSLKKIVQFATKNLYLTKLTGGIYNSNHSSKKIFSSAGFCHDPKLDIETEYDSVQFWIFRTK